ncbi:helix-turn-helix transcriptional regulator [Mycobacterium palustre]|uniref:HTH cro/C1-type domain-containing protein n=2 Tax=Mycobacterium palustre TaxID=153971 RepID=A0A1X1ZH03_9MYCO|nr:helix-turn-helix transcriptional regulator [Mycobacterium palustre]MCV7099459.1 helix-turn-helix transcriptional regulator [Mycobacterium palustre]ORW22401.1 hypothetical protein AWC19_13410 [Mycobacterium palustre]
MARANQTQASVAERLKISQQSLSRRISGEKAFDVGELETIAAVLGVPLDRLVGDAVQAAS